MESNTRNGRRDIMTAIMGNVINEIGLLESAYNVRWGNDHPEDYDMMHIYKNDNGDYFDDEEFFPKWNLVLAPETFEKELDLISSKLVIIYIVGEFDGYGVQGIRAETRAVTSETKQVKFSNMESIPECCEQVVEARKELCLTA